MSSTRTGSVRLPIVQINTSTTPHCEWEQLLPYLPIGFNKSVILDSTEYHFTYPLYISALGQELLILQKQKTTHSSSHFSFEHYKIVGVNQYDKISIFRGNSWNLYIKHDIAPDELDSLPQLDQQILAGALSDNLLTMSDESSHNNAKRLTIIPSYNPRNSNAYTHIIDTREKDSQGIDGGVVIFDCYEFLLPIPSPVHAEKKRIACIETQIYNKGHFGSIHPAKKIYRIINKNIFELLHDIMGKPRIIKLSNSNIPNDDEYNEDIKYFYKKSRYESEITSLIPEAHAKPSIYFNFEANHSTTLHSAMMMKQLGTYDLTALIDSGIQLSPLEILKYISKIISLVGTLHRKGLVHHDVKPDNLVVDVNHNLTLVDFGASHPINSGIKSYGTNAYMSPEIALRYITEYLNINDVVVGKIDEELVDVYAIGSSITTIIDRKLIDIFNIWYSYNLTEYGDISKPLHFAYETNGEFTDNEKASLSDLVKRMTDWESKRCSLAEAEEIIDGLLKYRLAQNILNNSEISTEVTECAYNNGLAVRNAFRSIDANYINLNTLNILADFHFNTLTANLNDLPENPVLLEIFLNAAEIDAFDDVPHNNLNKKNILAYIKKTYSEVQESVQQLIKISKNNNNNNEAINNILIAADSHIKRCREQFGMIVELNRKLKKYITEINNFNKPKVQQHNSPLAEFSMFKNENLYFTAPTISIEARPILPINNKPPFVPPLIAQDAPNNDQDNTPRTISPAH